MIHLLVTILCLITAASVAHAQTVVTSHDGLVYRGKIISRGVDSLKMRTEDGRIVTIANLQIGSIEESEESNDTAPPAPRERQRIYTDRPMFGASVLTPAGVNLIVGYRMGPFGARLSGLHMGKYYGAQFDLLANIGESDDFIHDLYVGIGIADNVNFGGAFSWLYHEWRYTALGYNVNWRGIFASGGLSFGAGHYTNPQVVFQVGYVKEVR